MTGISGQALLRILRETPERRVLLCRREDGECVTRILRVTTLQRHFDRIVRHATLEGKGSIAALGDDIAMTLEGYAVAARLLREPGTPPRWPRALDAGLTAEGHVYVSTSWIAGTPLHELQHPLRGDARARATEAILEVIEALHERGVAYGDLKLANLVLRPDGGVSLIDLDTLREVPGPDIGAPTRDRTASWAAPEQLHRHETFLGSDTWALGRVLTELWGDELPIGWRPALAACRAPEPTARPTVRSLHAHLADPSEPLTDPFGRACSPNEAKGSADGDVGTERVADTTIPNGTALSPSTERVPEGAPPGSGPRPPVASPAAQVPGKLASANNGCANVLFGLSKAALAAGLLVAILMCSGAFAWDLYWKNKADHDAEALLSQLKIHKTDPKKNGADERKRLAKDAERLWADEETARTCAVRALAMVWEQRWHFDDEWSPEDFEKASLAVTNPLCLHQPEAELAKATLYAGACRRRTPGVTSFTDCELAVAAIEPFWTTLPPGEGTNWLRVEAAWQEVRALSAMTARHVETGNAEAQGEGTRALQRCSGAEAWLPFAPVNGPELVEECLVVAGNLSDVPTYLHYADLRLATLPTDRKKRATLLTKLYTSAGYGCGDARYSYKKSGAVVVTGAPWCLAVGHLARGCGADAMAAMVEGSLGDPHPWLSIAASLPSRNGPCLE